MAPASFTPNRPLEEGARSIGDVPTVVAILDRFLHYSDIIEITGRSYRLKDNALQNSEDTCEEATETV